MPSDTAIVRNLAKLLVVARPADLPEKDWHGWDLAMQAMIQAQRDEARETEYLEFHRADKMEMLQ